jgi:hypothetical protein
MTGATQQAKKSKKQRKVGRNATYCNFYRLTNRREKNKVKKINRHLKKHSGDKVAKDAVVRLKNVIAGIKGE